jgi:hypothetical protein
VSSCGTINRDQSSQTLISLASWRLQRVYHGSKEKHQVLMMVDCDLGLHNMTLDLLLTRSTLSVNA